MSSEVVDVPSTSKITDEEKMEARLKSTNLIAQGKRNLICSEVPAAVERFQGACEILSASYGEMSIECAVAYFEYGCALLELARMEQNVLGNALEGVDMDSADDAGGDPDAKDANGEDVDIDDDLRHMLRVEVVNAMSVEEVEKRAALLRPATGEGQQAAAELEQRMLEAEMVDVGCVAECGGLLKDDDMAVDIGQIEGEACDLDQKVAEIALEEDGVVDVDMEIAEMAVDVADASDDAQNGSVGDEGDAEENQENEDEATENADDVSNLHLAWEMLDLSKVLYCREGTRESMLKAADAYIKLGEISLESEQYETAIADIRSCLEIQQELLDPSDRAIAETYYQLGLAYQMHSEHSSGLSCIQSAVECLRLRIRNLEEIVRSKPAKGPSDSADPLATAQHEIDDLLKVLPEIEAKASEAEMEMKSIERLQDKTKEIIGAIYNLTDQTTAEHGFGSSTGIATTMAQDETSATRSVMDINHLIRKKRRPGEQDEDKKQKQAGDLPAENPVHLNGAT